jgi:conserved oligomeric Golgi complex subunit 1
MTQIVKKALNIISQSVCTARSIFRHNASEPPLIGRVLESIQADSSKPDEPSPTLPDELYLSTDSLLANLTSSANFQLLPLTIKSYKPYVDLNSSSIFLAQPQSSQKVQTWFQQSSSLWQTCAGGWLTGLQTVKEVWTLRSSIRRWIMASGLKEEEIIHLLSTTDSLCHERIVRIWTQALTGAEALFKSRLNSYVSNSRLGPSHIFSGNFLVAYPSF